VASDLDPQQMQRLVMSHPWQAYLDVLLADFDRVSQHLDTSEGDHRFLQGLKQRLRVDIETPYRVAQLESPLARPDRRRPRRLAPREDQTQAPDAVQAVRRRSYLA